MREISLRDAEKQLRRLIEDAETGGQVVSRREDGAAFALERLSATPSRRTFGSAEGDVWMSEDFDGPLDDFQDYTR